jgi:uncharacterized protein
VNEKEKTVKKEVRYITFQVEVRNNEEGNESRTIQGYAAKYNSLSEVLTDWWGDEFVEVISEGAFDNSIRDNVIKGLWNHNSDLVLGSSKSGTLRLNSDSTGLHFEMDLPNNTWGNDAYESVKRGDVDGVSFGFRVKEDQYSKTEVDGKEILKRTLLEVDLFEISPTPFPAYGASEVDCRSLKSYKTDELRKIKQRQIAIELELI